MESFDPINIANAGYIEEMYERYKNNPGALNKDWVAFFKGFEFGAGGAQQEGSASEADEFDAENGMGKGAHGLVNAYRGFGHLEASLDPLGYERPLQPLLEISEYGFSEKDLDRKVGSGGFLGPTDGTLRDLIEKLRMTYCRTVGYEYVEIPYMSQRLWIQKRIEPVLNSPKFSKSQCHSILSHLVATEGFEQFLHTKYVGHKRFSVEGGESLIPLLTNLVETGAALEVEEIVMGMAHRGRLNVLTHLMHKPYEAILCEFEGSAVHESSEGSGDVKYHMGYSHDYITQQEHKVHLSLSPNPSHLELVNPIIEGIVYAKQENRNDLQRSRVVPILIHGDASFTGQGIVDETLNLCQLNGYDTGGTIHIIINNQIGFTATPRQTRFTSYPSDSAKIIQAPVFHVNADDPEAVVQIGRLAMSFRQAFKADVVIDLWCYRKYGHNEADDPSFTQPGRYREIDKHPSVCDLYFKSLQEHNLIDQGEYDKIRGELRRRLDESLEVVHNQSAQPRMSSLKGFWKGLGRASGDGKADTAVKKTILTKIVKKATTAPPDFSVYRKLQRLLKSRIEMVEGKLPIDWGCAEMLALGSLLLEGISIRLTGQDSQRGTFSHRHGVWHDVKTGKPYWPLANLSDKQGKFTLMNTMLSELAVLGFEYGISSADPWRLTIWEAQFGDFANMAQAIIDQYISSCEAKWGRMSGIVLLLPHGYEGQGPEHSSARLERYLQLCAENNIQVCYPTIPSQYFHMLRRQMHRSFRKPLILMMPKSLLRHKQATSDVSELAEGRYREIIDDPTAQPQKVNRLVFCTGKVYFNLLEARDAAQKDDVALIRIEQLYPFAFKEAEKILARYTRAKEICWTQEEPQNQGAWDFIEPKLRKVIKDGRAIPFIGRGPSASTATGVHKAHLAEQDKLVSQALNGSGR